MAYLKQSFIHLAKTGMPYLLSYFIFIMQIYQMKTGASCDSGNMFTTRLLKYYLTGNYLMQAGLNLQHGMDL